MSSLPVPEHGGSFGCYKIRIMVQDKVRALKRQPREEDRNMIEIERTHIRAQLDQYLSLCPATCQVGAMFQQLPQDPGETAFDDLEVEPPSENNAGGDVHHAAVERNEPDPAAEPEASHVVGLPENMSLLLPSTTPGDPALAAIELRL